MPVVVLKFKIFLQNFGLCEICNMLKFIAVLTAFLLVAASKADDDLALSGDSKVKLPGTNDKCAAYCLATYSPHTSGQVFFKRTRIMMDQNWTKSRVLNSFFL